jgi:hypothetical protein
MESVFANWYSLHFRKRVYFRAELQTGKVSDKSGSILDDREDKDDDAIFLS